MRALALVVCAVLVQTERPPIPWVAVSPGVEHASLSGGVVSGVVPGVQAGQQPAAGSTSARQYALNALRIDPRLVDLQIVHALDQAVGLETTSSIAARRGAIAAVNGGFFRTTGTYRGDSLGALMIDGELLSEPDRGRSIVAIVRTPGGARVSFGHAAAVLSVSVGTATRPVSGINRPRGAGELVVYTPAFHRTTLTTPDGTEAIVRRGRVDRIVDAGSQAVPADGFVLSAAGDAAAWLRQHARRGRRATLSRRLMPLENTSGAAWAGAEDVLGAGPQLLRNGRVEITAAREQMSVSLSTERHPRTAIGAAADGRVLLAVVDGRQPGFSDGMLLEELAGLMLSLGAVDAINLDGGGSFDDGAAGAGGEPAVGRGR